MRPRRPGFIWLLLPAAIWAVQFLVAYLGVAIWCARWPDTDPAPLRLLIALSVLLSLLLLGGVAAGIRRRTRLDPQSSDPQQRASEVFIARLSLLLSLVAAIAALYGLIPLVLMDRCA
jgi:hypothetical protein